MDALNSIIRTGSALSTRPVQSCQPFGEAAAGIAT
jgi:hypothetical protein